MSKELEIGTLLLNKYRLEAKLGQGGFGSVYLATDILLGRKVAIKTLSQTQTSLDAQRGEGTFEIYLARFQREAMVSAFFTRNPNIIGVYGLEQDRDNYYLILEYVDGGALTELLQSTAEPLPLSQACAIALDLCNALSEIHRHPADIVHRDLKPANVLLRKDGQALIADFGIAQLGQESARTDYPTLGHPGSPAYKSPEQATVNTYLTPASDLYSLGLILYEMVTGRVYARIKQLPPSQLNPQIPQWLDQIIIKLLQENPAQRYQRAGEVSDSIRAGLGASSGWQNQPQINGWGQPAGFTSPYYSPTEPTASLSQASLTAAAWESPGGSPLLTEPYRPDLPLVETERKKATRPFLVLGLLSMIVLVMVVGVLTLTRKQSIEVTEVSAATATPRTSLFGSTNTAVATPTIAATFTVAPTKTTVRPTPTRAVTPVPTPATASPETIAIVDKFDQRKKQAAGPEKGTLKQQTNGDLGELAAKGNLRDFVADVKFTNAVSPYIDIAQDWDYGFIFRSTSDKFYHLFVTYRQEWGLTLYETIDGRTKSTKVASGKLSNLDVSEKASNRLMVYASGGEGYFYINQQYVATLNLSAHQVSGEVEIVTGANTNQINGKLSPTIVPFENFTVYSLE